MEKIQDVLDKLEFESVFNHIERGYLQLNNMLTTNRRHKEMTKMTIIIILSVIAILITILIKRSMEWLYLPSLKQPGS